MAAVTNRVLPDQVKQVRTDLRRINRAIDDGSRLKRGDKGPAVKSLQRALRDAGVYHGEIDGKFDGGVEKAVKRFQRAHDLHAGGKVGQKVLKELRGNNLFLEDHFEKPAKRGQGGKDVRQAERRLNALGYRTGKVDGIFDDKTARAVRAFRKDHDNLNNDSSKLNRKVWENLQQAFQSQVVNKGRPDVQRPGDKSKAVRKTEKRLEAIGLEPGKVDGRYTAATASAVATFQRREGIKVTGRVNERTTKALAEEAKRAQGPSPHASRGKWFISQFRGKYNRNEDTYSDNGNCGPTSVTMIASAFGKVNIKGHRADAAIEKSRKRFGQSLDEHKGTTVFGARKALESYGLNTSLHRAKPSRDTLKNMKKQLAKGKLVLCNVVPKFFSERLTNGHFTVVTAIKNGKVYLNDPGTNRGPMTISTKEFLRCLKLRHSKESSTFGWIAAKG